MVAARKSETVNLRIDSQTRDVIQRAAAMSGKSLTSFMTDAAYSAAQRELLDQRFVGVDATVFDAVQTLLSEPATANAELAALFSADRDWID